MKQKIIDKINRLASQKEPFLFVINYQADEAFIRKLSDINPEECLFDFEGRGNWRENHSKEMGDSKKNLRGDFKGDSKGDFGEKVFQRNSFGLSYFLADNPAPL